ncbi:hypothetical protein CEP54_000146 [Fusarium duplospermum]|uniref:Uncharacterized protein n=1 Tax=Fusarium duplospermum TaxID=1325734 RepID=A0A428R8S5_9HYPO|nr:hypothetical protein CEP54_000146 [Fusarium duplospermum]
MTSSEASAAPAAVREDIPNLIDDIRSRSPRSALIAEKVELVKADWQTGNHQTLIETLQEYVPLELMDVAMSTFNLVRIPFQTQRPVQDRFAGCLLRGRIELTSAWSIALYFTDTLGDWTKLREFLELADNIRQLATAYCCIPDPEEFWIRMDQLWDETTPLPIPEADAALLPSTRRCMVGMVRRILMRNLERNPPGQPPTDLGGEPIDAGLFHNALRMNWEEERGQRSCHLLGLHRRGIIDVSECRPILREWQSSWQPINEFHWAVLRARGVSICSSRLNLNERQEARLLGELSWMSNYELGVQGYALCLPLEGEDYYDRQFLVQITRSRRQMTTFFSQVDGDDANFADGWFQRFPAALPPLQG